MLPGRSPVQIKWCTEPGANHSPNFSSLCVIEHILIDHEGTPYKRYNGKVPNDLVEDIEILLKKKEKQE